MNFVPYNFPLKFFESIGTLTPKVGAHLGVWGFIPSHSFAFPGSLLACNFASPCLGCEPKVKVARHKFFISYVGEMPRTFASFGKVKYKSC